MKSTELRLGNWVYDTKGNKNRVDVDALNYMVGYGGTPHCQVKPIPLTPEILEKAGFGTYHKRWEIYFESFNIIFAKNESGEVEGCFLELIGMDVFYLHQLQNLYFALTGEELNIEL